MAVKDKYLQDLLTVSRITEAKSISKEVLDRLTGRDEVPLPPPFSAGSGARYPAPLAKPFDQLAGLGAIAPGISKTLDNRAWPRESLTNDN